MVHARGAAAHGLFRAYGSAASVTKAPFLAEEGRETPVFVRFSTVLGSRGSADTVRDVRGFAVKFYTAEGNFDLVGNNMPVFFIQDGIKFPDIIHAGKPHPDREIPQAQTAHDTFWDFVSLHTEATHHVMWAMSDRGIPRSFRTMEGFGVHTFRLVNSAGESSLAKFHWKPTAGVHSLVWEEAQLAAGTDPDFHRRDMADAIDAGAFIEYELGIQVMADSDDETFEGIDLLDPTKIVPEELAPVQPVGMLTLNRNPDNFFAETEQVAFHTGNLVPGIEVTNDPLMQARLFSYLDTQLTRLGGPNFTQLPINRPHAPVNDNLRDGMHQTAVHRGVAPYLPNSLAGDEGPVPAEETRGGYVQIPRLVEGEKVRANPVSFDDHFSQATMFYVSMSPIEKAHLIEAFTFELGKCYEKQIRERTLGVLANVDADLCAQVAAGLGLLGAEGETGHRCAAVAGVVPDRRGSRSDRRTGPRRRRGSGRRPGRDWQDSQSVRGPRRVRAGHRGCRRSPEEGRTQRDHRADPADHPLDRVRRGPGRRRRRQPRRPQTLRPAGGGLPACQGARRVGRRQTSLACGRHRHQGSGDPARRRGGRRVHEEADRRGGPAPGVGPRAAGDGPFRAVRSQPRRTAGLRYGGRCHL
nr:hypothetical protein GCM10020092_055420 [Actinoplanes digitatis]